ncbi:tetratricopeptide repeat protein [Oxalobacteraceae bacterium OTU3CINTB1]|nr:tetratricopeptide repeat protein [Oxalobacteraceae bacterium OTU3CINTB1]
MTQHMTTDLNFLQRLNVGEDADERAIRRAYARELKLIDQETDPIGFQTLREAYETALDWQRHHAAQPFAAQIGSEDRPDDAGQPIAAFATPGPAPAAERQQAAPAEGHPTAPSDSHSATPASTPDDPHAVAAAVFEEFLRRAGALVEARAISSDAPWRHALGLCLADDRLVHIIARDLFEQHVADLLAQGWQPGHDVLLEAATKVFGWHNDRRRTRALGYAGYVLDSAIDERSMFDTLADRDYQQQLIERLRDPRPPTARELLAHTTPMAMLFSRFPTWMPLVTSAANMALWREKEGALPGWRRMFQRAKARTSEHEFRWRFNWKWAIFIAVITLARVGWNSGSADNNMDETTRRHAQSTGQPSTAARENLASLLAKADDMLQQGDYDGAIATYTRVIQLDPRNSVAYSNRALAALFTKAGEAGIVADLDRAAELDSNNANVPRARGLLALRHERYDEAIAEFSRAQELYPDHPYTLDKRAEAYARAGRYDLALADIDRRLKVAPTGNVDAYRLRLQILIRQGNEADALAQIETMIGANKNNAEAYYYAASLYRNAGQERQAIFMLERGIAEAPVSTLYLARELLRERADLAGRRDDIAKCVANSFCVHYALEQRIELELDDGKPEAALKLIAAEIDGGKLDYASQPAMLAYRALVYAKTGQAKLAEAGFDAARAAAGTRLAQNNLAWFLATHNTALPRALSAIDAALAGPEQIPAYLDTKAMVLLRMGRDREAVAAYDKVLASRSGMASSRFGRGLAKRRAGDRAGGDADLKEARLASPGVDDEYARMGLRP